MNKKNIALILLAIIAGLSWYAYTAYNEGPRDLRNANTDEFMTATELLASFQADEAKANADYLDKVISVEGDISSIDMNEPVTITLEAGDMMSAVVCEMAKGELIQGVNQGSPVRIKGQCTGFLSDVILVKCVIESK